MLFAEGGVGAVNPSLALRYDGETQRLRGVACDENGLAVTQFGRPPCLAPTNKSLA
jgi:hypothetical protein